MTKNHGPQIKDDEQYEALRRQGSSKEKSARIANSGRNASKRGGRSSPYEHWNKAELLAKAREVDITGRSKMTKSELINALRDH